MYIYPLLLSSNTLITKGPKLAIHHDGKNVESFSRRSVVHFLSLFLSSCRSQLLHLLLLLLQIPPVPFSSVPHANAHLSEELFLNPPSVVSTPIPSLSLHFLAFEIFLSHYFFFSSLASENSYQLHPGLRPVSVKTNFHLYILSHDFCPHRLVLPSKLIPEKGAHQPSFFFKVSSICSDDHPLILRLLTLRAISLFPLFHHFHFLRQCIYFFFLQQFGSATNSSILFSSSPTSQKTQRDRQCRSCRSSSLMTKVSFAFWVTSARYIPQLNLHHLPVLHRFASYIPHQSLHL